MNVCPALVALILFSTNLVSAQTHRATSARSQPGDFRLVAVNVSGTDRYTPEQIMAAADLRIGDMVSEDVFNRAVQTLGEAGVFSNVAFTYSYSPTGTRLELKVADNDRLVPAVFENIVWFPDDQLLAEIRRRVPLFLGKLPVGGNLADQVSDALQAILLQSHLPGHAEYIRSGPKDGPIDAIVFSVENVNLKIREVKITGAGPDELPPLQAKAQKMVDGDYSRVRVEAFEKHDLLPILFARGYLKAAFSPPAPTVHSQTEEDTLLDLTLAAEPGRVYKLSTLEWEGNKAFTAEKLTPLVHLTPGQPANGTQLDSDLEEVGKLYGTRGYMRARITPDPQFDEQKGTVDYRLQVHEGDLYHMGELDIRGLDSKTTSELHEKWNLSEGAPYDTSYTKRFLESAWKLLASQVDWTVNVHEAVDDQEKTVDVSLVYGVRASR